MSNDACPIECRGGEHVLCHVHGVKYSVQWLGISYTAEVGGLWMTNERLVLFSEGQKPAGTAWAFELLNIFEEDIRQPIFGASHILFVNRACPDGMHVHEGKVEVYFKKGGLDTFVQCFVPRMARVQTVRRQQRQSMPQETPQETVFPEAPAQTQQSQPTPTQVDGMGGSPHAAAGVAYVDPNDSSEIYIASSRPIPSAPPMPSNTNTYQPGENKKNV